MAVAAGVGAVTFTTPADTTTAKGSTTEKYESVEYPTTNSTVSTNYNLNTKKQFKNRHYSPFLS